MSASILVVDSCPPARGEIASALRAARVCDSIYQAPSARQGLNVLEQTTVDLVICALAVPGVDGFGFLRSIRCKEAYRDLPVIMVTDCADLETKVEGFELGASDFMVSPFDDQELVARTRRHLRMKKQQDQLKKDNQQLQTLSRTDPLTGLGNRRCFMETLQREIQRSRHSGAPLSMIMADLDHFKRINDAFGHPTGDEVLVAISAVLRGTLREYDLVSRYGGEEFAVVLPETGLENAVQIAERLRCEVNTFDMSRFGHPTPVSISLGVATYGIGNCYNIELLIGAADAALYEAKRAGRNCVKSQGKVLPDPRADKAEAGRISLPGH